MRQLSRGVSQRLALRERTRSTEADLLEELFRRTGRTERIQQATPAGYCFVPAAESSSESQQGPIVQVAAHPGDGPDFFYATYLQIAAQAARRPAYHEVLLTDGEQGVEGWHPEYTRSVRIEEAYAGAELVGSRLHFLGYPDGGLVTLPLPERARLVARLVKKLEAIQPGLLVTHSPKLDHPDHAFSFLLTLAALRQYTTRGHRPPALLVHDVEFGLQQRSLWRLRAANEASEHYPVHLPGQIVNITASFPLALQALQKHHTQMADPVSGQPKLYSDLIATLAQLRGQQIPTQQGMCSYGQGFTQVIIPGLTNPQPYLGRLLSTGQVWNAMGSCCP